MSAVTDPSTGGIVAWKDRIPLAYEYTAGVAGEAFLRGLREGRILASKCGRCGDLRLPPRSYCVVCGGRTRVDVEVVHCGRLSAVSKGGGPSGEAFVFVVFAGVSGGLLHRAAKGRRAPREGEPVRPRFEPQEARRGSILDVAGFEVASSRKRGND